MSKKNHSNFNGYFHNRIHSPIPLDYAYTMGREGEDIRMQKTR